MKTTMVKILEWRVNRMKNKFKAKAKSQGRGSWEFFEVMSAAQQRRYEKLATKWWALGHSAKFGGDVTGTGFNPKKDLSLPPNSPDEFLQAEDRHVEVTYEPTKDGRMQQFLNGVPHGLPASANDYKPHWVFKTKELDADS